MPPREFRTRVKQSQQSSTATKKRQEVSAALFKKSATRVIKAVRDYKLKQRQCAREFEVKPDPELFPLYYQLIREPISLVDIENLIANGTIADVNALVSKFKLLVSNAKSFNKPGSTISKDASRLYEVFQQAMKTEFDMLVDEVEDEGEEDAWARDLANRPKLAMEERAAYREVLASWDNSGSIPKRTPEERGLREFVKDPLATCDVSFDGKLSKKDFSRSHFVSEVEKLKIGASAKKNVCKLATCLICSDALLCAGSHAHSPNLHNQTMLEVPIPKIREVTPPVYAKRPFVLAFPPDDEEGATHTDSSHVSRRKQSKQDISSPIMSRSPAKRAVLVVEPFVSKKIGHKRSESPDHVSALHELSVKLRRARAG